MKKLLSAGLLTAALCSAAHAAVLFDFRSDTALYGALSGKTGPVTYTNSGLVATFTASDGTMNRTASGFGINATNSLDDTDAFDGNEWIDITFGSAVTLSNVTVSSWGGIDAGAIYVNGVSNGVITSTGAHVFNIGVPAGQVLRIASTSGVVTNNGWSLDSMTVELDAPPANLAPVLAVIGNKSVIVSNALSFTVSATDGNGDSIVLSASNLPPGAVFNMVTNASVVSNTFSWANAAPTGTYTTIFSADDGITNVSETITITVGTLPSDVTFDFFGDTNLYGALEGKAGPIAYTNSGLAAVFTASTGTMHRLSTGFGLSPNDNDAFDAGEWIDITFDIAVALTNINVSSWSLANGDQAVIYVNGVSNAVITSTGNHAFDITVPPGQILQIKSTAGVVGNGWSLNSITVKTDTNAPAAPTAEPLLISEIADPNGTGAGGYLARFVELYNAGTNTIDLAAGGWTLSRQNNGGTWYDAALTGTIGPAETFVVGATTNFPDAYGFAPDQTNSVTDGNGVDAYFLFVGGDHTGGILVDVYGELDTDGTGTAWEYTDSRVRRNNQIVEPNTIWMGSEWTITPNSATNMLTPGTHGPAPTIVLPLRSMDVTPGGNVYLPLTAVNEIDTNDVITLSAISLPGDSTFPTVIGTGTVESAWSWSPTNAGTYTAIIAAEGVLDATYESITIYVLPAAPPPPVITSSIIDGSLVMTWDGGPFNVLTNGDLTNPGGWGVLMSGASSPFTNAIGSESRLFYKLESP